MVKKIDNNKRIILKQLKEYRKINMHYRGPCEEFWLKISDWDSTMVKNYKSTRNLLSQYKDDYPVIKEQYRWLPRSVWFMRSYRFEIVFSIFLITYSFLYFYYIPVYKGQFSFWLCGSFLIFFFSRVRVISKGDVIDQAIDDIIITLSK